MDAGENVNEVEGAGNTPLHCAAYEGWEEGVELLLSLGAKVNASNNAGDRPWHWARNMGHNGVMDLLERVRSDCQVHFSAGRLLVVIDIMTGQSWPQRDYVTIVLLSPLLNSFFEFLPNSKAFTNGRTLHPRAYATSLYPYRFFFCK